LNELAGILGLSLGFVRFDWVLDPLLRQFVYSEHFCEYVARFGSRVRLTLEKVVDDTWIDTSPCCPTASGQTEALQLRLNHGGALRAASRLNVRRGGGCHWRSVARRDVRCFSE